MPRGKCIPVTRRSPAALLALAGLLPTQTGCFPSPPRSNVLLITIDTLRADRLGCYGYASARTPAIDALARDGVRATDAIAAAPVTLPSHATILTGLYPPAHGVRDNGNYALGDDAVTLAERFARAGYVTQAVVSAIVLNRRYNLAQGFENYDDDLWASDEPQLFMIRDRPGPESAARVVRWLEGWSRDRERRPFFLWLHLFDPHQPYAARPDGAPGRYDDDVAHADEAVGLVTGALDRLAIADATLVVLTADHGESLGEHGEKTHSVFVYDATVRVPLVWRWPGHLPAGRVYDGPVRSVDIAPTLLAALGLPGGGETQGVDLLGALRGEKAAPELAQYSESLVAEVGFGMAPLYALRRGGHKWIRAPRSELYDLRSDTGETRNLALEQPEIGADMDRELSSLLAASRARKLDPRDNPMDRETEENLRALGYLAGADERRSLAGLDPKDGMPLYSRLEEARHLAQEERWDEAEVRLREILDATPENLTALNVLALCRERRGDRDGARALYRQALALEPKQARIHHLLANMALDDGDLAAAEAGFRRTLEISPGFIESMSGLGMVAALRGDSAGAQAWYERAIASDPGFPWVYRRLADLEYERGEFALARQHYERALELAREDFSSLVQAGNSARRTGDFAGARALFVRAAELRPDSWIPAYNIACLDAISGDSAKAMASLRRAVELGLARPELLQRDEDLASLRSLPGFSGLVEAVNARAASGGRVNAISEVPIAFPFATQFEWEISGFERMAERAA